MQKDNLEGYKQMLKVRVFKTQKNPNMALAKFAEIDKIDKLKEEDKDEFYLRKIVSQRRQISQFESNDSFIQLILEKNSYLDYDDLSKIGLTESQVSLVDKFLLKTTAFKEWCDHLSSNVQKVPTNGSQSPDRASTTTQMEPEKYTINRLQVAQMEFSMLQKKRDQKIQRQRSIERVSYINLLLIFINENYGNIFLLEAYLLNLELSYLTNFSFVKSVKEVEEILKRQNRWSQSVADYFKQYEPEQSFGSAEQIQKILKKIQPIDIHKVKVVSQSRIRHEGSILPVIGETGSGKTTLILSLIGYKLQSVIQFGRKALRPKGKIASNHKDLVTSSSIKSTTDKISAYEFECEGTKQVSIDLPGYSDSNGFEIDAQNQISLRRALEDCQSICYLYVVDLASLKINKKSLSLLAESIACRFEFTALLELTEMVLLIFNKKHIDYEDHQIINLPHRAKAAAQLAIAKDDISPKVKIAFQFVADSLQNNPNFFDPFDEASVALIKSSINKLKFNKKNKINIKFESKFENTLLQQNQILSSNIRFYLNQESYDIVRFYYDQLITLSQIIKHQKTKIVLQEIKKQIRNSMQKIENCINMFLDNHIKDLQASEQGFTQFTRKCSTLHSLTHILSDKETQNRVIKSIDKHLELISAKINTQSNQEKINNIILIFTYFLKVYFHKDLLKIKAQHLELKCSQRLVIIAKDIHYQYESINGQKMDRNYENYQVLYQSYKLFASSFAQFQKLKLIKQPKELIKAYIDNQEQIFKKFSKNLAKMQCKFQENKELEQEELTTINQLSNKCQRFASSKYISFKQKANAKQLQCKKKLSLLCETYSSRIQNIFVSPNSFSEEITKIIAFMMNLNMLAKNISILSINDTFIEKKALILLKVEESRRKFEENLLIITANINQFDTKLDSFIILKFIDSKLKLYEACKVEQFSSLQDKFKNFQAKLSQLTEQCKQSIKKDFRKLNSVTIIKIFKTIRSMERYRDISSVITNKIEKLKMQFDTQLSKYFKQLTQIIPNKGFRSVQHQKKFNNNYCDSIIHFADYLFEPCKNILHSMTQRKILELYEKTKTSLENICSFVVICIDISPQKHENFKDFCEEEQKHISWLLEDFRYVITLRDFYKLLGKLNNSNQFCQFLNDSDHFERIKFTGSIPETLNKIEQFVQKRFEKIEFQVKLAKQRPTSINLKSWQETLKEVRAFKSFQDSKQEKTFQNLELKIYEMVNLFHDKHLSQIQSIINIDLMKIDFFDCGQMYSKLNELKNNSLASSHNFQKFLNRLRRFVSSKCQQFTNNLKLYEIFDIKNRQNLFLATQYSDKLHKMISFEDVKTLKIELFQVLDGFTLKLIRKMQEATLEKIQSLKDMIESKRFNKNNKQLSNISEISNKINDFIEDMVNKKIYPYFSNPECEQLLKSRQIIRRIQQLNILKDDNITQISRIVQNPLSEVNRKSLLDVYDNALSGPKQLMSKIITQQMNKLLENYKCCRYYESKKLEKVISQHLSYIPQSIIQRQGLRNNFKDIKDSKLKRQQAQLERLLQEEHSQNVLINKLLIKLYEFHLIQQFQLKEKVQKHFNNKFKQIQKTILSKSNRIEDTIQVSRNSFWSLVYKTSIGNHNNFFLPQIESSFKELEKEIYSFLEKNITSTLNSCKKIFNDNYSEPFDEKKVRSDIKSLQYFVSVFQKGIIVHFEVGYNELLKKINKNTQDWSERFDKICPIQTLNKRLNEKDMNPAVFKRQFKACFVKASLFHIIYDTLARSERNENTMDIEQDIQVIQKVSTIKQTIDQNIKKSKEQLENIQFNEKIDLSSKEIEIMLVNLNRQAIFLDIYEQSILESKTFISFTATNFNDTVKLVQKKLNNFVQQFLKDFQGAFKEPQKQIPKGLYFLEILLDRIDSNFGHKIFEKRRPDPLSGEMIDETYTRFISNPKKEFNKHIEECLNKLLPLVKQARELFVSINKKQLNQELSKLQDQCNKKCQTYQLEYKDNLKTIQEQNQQGSPQLVQRSLQAKALFQSNKNAEQDKTNHKKNTLIKRFQQSTAQRQKKYATFLLILKKIEFGFTDLNSTKTKLVEALRNQLDFVKRANKICRLSNALKKYDFKGYADHLKRDSLLFAYQYHLQFKKRTEAQNIDYVCQNLKNIQQTQYSKQEKKEIFNEYNQFDGYFNKILADFKDSKNISKTEMLKKIITEAIQQYKKAIRIKRIAIILAVWSLFETSNNPINNDDKQPQDSQDQGKTFEIRPHPVQVAAALLLTKPNQKNQIKSQLCQVLTGQGKSIILATLAIFFAKQGKKVIVSCYSSYLCERDFKKFDELFRRFNVKQQISYMTFYQICEQILNNKVKENITKLLSKESALSKIGGTVNNVIDLVSLQAKNSILLIDEVDVLFEKEFFGNTYKPMLKLNDQASKHFIQYVFKKLSKNSKCTVKEIQQSKQFKNLLESYPKMKEILLNQVYGMKQEFLKVPVQYSIVNKMIKYKDNDQLSAKKHFGYETIFAYCRQFDCPENSLFIPIIAGQFSYSELPKYYSSMIGLSGTIQHLPREKIDFLEKQYSIAKTNMYLLPSIYGQNNQRTEELIITSSKTYTSDLIQRILRHNKTQVGRPVLVCFESYAKLQKFVKSKQFIDSKLTPAFLHEHIDHGPRDNCIKTVGNPHKVTLMTSQFSRGTDYIIYDQNIKDNGGLHLILTYVPELASQFIQFCGRTARMGQKGSIDVLLTQQEARQKQITSHKKEILDNLKPYMDKINMQQDILNKQKISKSLKRHQKTNNLLKNIVTESNQYLKFLYDLNQYPEIRQSPIKIIIGVDGTNSMNLFFKEILKQLQIIMQRITEMANTQQLSSSFLIQVVVYRNYNCGEKIIEASGYFDSLLGLKDSLKNVKVNGGLGNQAIQMLYRFVNLEGDVDMIILIGDAPPNTPAEVQQNRNLDEWLQFLKNNPKSKKELFKKTNSAAQQKAFSEKIIVNGLYICGNQNVNEEEQTAEEYFKRVASSHHGKAQELNFNKPNYSQHMIKFFTTNILTAANGIQAENKINMDYQMRYRPPGYIS